MSLSPISNTTETSNKLYSLTYKLDIDQGELLNTIIDEKDAIRQSIYKIINTPRNRYGIYSSDYGSDIEKIVSENLPIHFLREEIPRELRTSILIDARIRDLRDFVVNQTGEGLYVEFTVETVDGLTWTEGVTL